MQASPRHHTDLVRSCNSRIAGALCIRGLAGAFVHFYFSLHPAMRLPTPAAVLAALGLSKGGAQLANLHLHIVGATSSQAVSTWAGKEGLELLEPEGADLQRGLLRALLLHDLLAPGLDRRDLRIVQRDLRSQSAPGGLRQGSCSRVGNIAEQGQRGVPGGHLLFHLVHRALQ